MAETSISSSNNILVSISMITYGHEKFIASAIEGILLQETNFKYELIISNDCSPDNTSSIVEHYKNNHPKGHLIQYFRHDKNIGVLPNAIFCLEKCTGKYIALCEGDDYWTDVLKLQKQVDFLESNSCYSLIVTEGNRLVNNVLINDKITSFAESRKLSIEEILENASIPTCTFMFRNGLKYPKWFSEIKNGDTALFYLLSKQGDIYFLNDVTAVYRVHSTGIYSGANTDKKIEMENQLYHALLNDSNNASWLKNIYDSKLINFSFHYAIHANKKMAILQLKKVSSINAIRKGWLTLLKTIILISTPSFLIKAHYKY